MSKRRTIASVTTGGLVVAALAACGGADEGAGSGDQPFAGEELNVLMVQEPAVEELRDVYVPEFEEATGITVNIEMLPESGADTRMMLALSQGTGEFDVVETGAKSWSQLVGSGWIIPLDEYFEEGTEYTDGFNQQLLASLQLEGSTYAVPYSVGANMLFYNKQMFEDAGLDPEQPPNSMEELLEYAEALHAPDEGRNGIVFRGTREGNANSFAWIMMWFLNGGRWVTDAGEQYAEALVQEPAIRTAEQYRDLAQFAPRDISNYNFTEAQVAMQQGEAAMWLDSAQLGPALEDPEQSLIAGDVGYHVLEGEGDDYVVGPVWAFSITDTAANPDAAWEFIEFITGKDVALGQALSGTRGSPARSDVLTDPQIGEAMNPDFAEALDNAIAHANPEYSPLIAEGAEIRSALSLGLSEVLSGQKEPEQAMREASSSVEGILAD